MGLSASQARLLSITARKSDCEFQSMQLSHEKLSISRDLALLSNQYQASLNQTKLMYDYYGTGTSMEQMNYNTLMSPSSLNDFRPITMTNSLNRVILDSRLASAAREAGIPQEGLGCSPSSDVRNKFAEGLMNAGVIDASVYNSIIKTPYNQAAGLGSDGTSFENTVTYTLNDIYDLILESSASHTVGDGMNKFDTDPGNIDSWKDAYFDKDFGNAKGDGERFELESFTTSEPYSNKVDDRNYLKSGSTLLDATLYDLLNATPSNQKQYFLTAESVRGELTPISCLGGMQHLLLDQGGFLDWLTEEFTNALGFNDKCLSAIRYAKEEVTTLITGGDGYPTTLMKCYNNTGENKFTDPNGIVHNVPYNKDIDENSEYSNSRMMGGRVYYGCNIIVDPVGTRVPWGGFENIANTNHVGFVFTAGDKDNGDDGDKHTYAGLNMNNLAKVFLTEFANCMKGLQNGKTYEVNKGPVEGSQLVTDDENFSFDVTTLVEMDGSNSRVVAFYDTLLNQIANDGWAENNEVQDPEYLQEMIQNGMMFITNMSDDGFYYQRNYETFSYVKEVSDESEIAKAEADYRANKEKLNMKEQKLDLKMKNLDTEISSLTTEYDTVKNVISKNIEKGFKRYSA